MNDWPTWMRVKLKNDADFISNLGDGVNSVYGAGSLNGPPSRKPFLIIHSDDDARGPFPGMGQSLCSIHVHDEPGSYARIRTILHKARLVLCGPTLERATLGTGAEAGGMIRWLNDSADLADEGFNTIVRTSQYQLNGADGDD